MRLSKPSQKEFSMDIVSLFCEIDDLVELTRHRRSTCLQSAKKYPSKRYQQMFWYFHIYHKQVSILNLRFWSPYPLEDWKIGSREGSEHSTSSYLPFFHPSWKLEVCFLILLKYGKSSRQCALVVYTGKHPNHHPKPYNAELTDNESHKQWT